MNFLSMEYFAAVAREKSFTKAAEKLHITQQTLSAHIAAIERELGCQLLLRHVPLKLTYAGQVFLRYAAAFQQEYTAMKQEFCDITNSQRGILRVGIAHTRGRAIMPALIDAFQRQYPDISIYLVEASNDVLHKYVLAGDVELAIANFPEVLQGMELRDFYREEMVLLASGELLAAHGVDRARAAEEIVRGDLSALAGCPFVLGTPGDINSRIGLSVLRQSGLRPTIRAESDNVETLLSLCLRGVGACFCPKNLMQTALSPEQLASLEIFCLGGSAEYPIRFGYLKQPYQWSMISEFIRISRQLLDK